ncbi:MAG: hypothetical protein IKH96_02815 [Ruminococcus sp.]|uniref:hypothetical protein n=1 Tax=Ruminococcus sp. TaxID=41978 RepID=UPI0025E81075|nr:hypothetical protein [Ruminococcus sp.]MBR6994933.1 hypothetical protein [Ruminococcus sp.]
MNDKSSLNAIPIPKIKLEYPLATDDPTLITAEALQKELYDIGLNCGYTRIDRLETYIKETIATLPDGTLEGYKIFNTNAGEINDYLKSGGLRKSFSDVVTDTSIHANWQPQDICPYKTELAVIAFPEHFDYLRNNYINFASSIKDINIYEGDESHLPSNGMKVKPKPSHIQFLQIQKHFCIRAIYAVLFSSSMLKL